MACAGAVLDFPRPFGLNGFHRREGAIGWFGSPADGYQPPAGQGYRRFASTCDGRAISVSMIPDDTPDQRLRDVLLAAKRANNFGRGNAEAKLAHVEPLIHALDRALSARRDVGDLVKQLLATVREVPMYPADPMMGSEPLCYRYVVAKPADFDKIIMRLRAEFPEVL